MSSYGLWPVDVMTSWLADDAMVLAAQAGTSIGSGIYEELNPRMVQAPRSVVVAYEQAAYFLALGARRALREGNSAAADVLLTELDRVLAEGNEIKGETTFLCRTAGVACPRGGAGRVLADAAEVIETSGLNPDDAIQIESALRTNRRSFLILQALPVIGAVGLGAVIGTWWYRTQQ